MISAKGRKMEDGRWKMEDGRWKMAITASLRVKRWKMEIGRRLKPDLQQQSPSLRD
ncbi:hypothetical protein IQ269_26785 [Tychonema sp. LEGE 07199]|uniref:hypothetical protein n=1 Tax=unclassified Tychonema TaxID=2642144 RepID=UPI0018807BDE|nr:MULTISPECIES: hypothetical protein [unclassified Tychonema]MBE9124305.1 hypothetical protein [Tychonema sp. LEGE 07199]MBE9135149.1 hypothetical protein [Tychonema sp. LEGE 07196]